MRLYMQQKVFSLTDKFFVKDELGTDRFYVEGELFTWGKKLHLFNMDGSEVAFISQKILSFHPKFFVDVDGLQIAEIIKRFSFLCSKYTITGLDWEVDGDFWEHNYSIMHGSECIVTIQKKWMTWGDVYEIEIADGADIVSALAVVLAIDCVIEMQQR